MKIDVKKPWLNFYGDVPSTLEYSELTMSGEFEECAKKFPSAIAYDFMGKKTTYEVALKKIEACARALKAYGLRRGDRVTVCLPNCPQAITMFYAINMAGGIANMIHPLSSENEIAFFLNDSKSVLAITLNQFFPKFENIRNKCKTLRVLIITSIADELKPLMSIGYKFIQSKKLPKIEYNALNVEWKTFLNKGKLFDYDYKEKLDKNEPAVILYSGGTTGVTKGILLSNYNFNALGKQIIEMSNAYEPNLKMLAVMPIFHGFGLGVSIHSMLISGMSCILVPRFTVKSYAKLIKKERPNFIAGVPTLYEALLRDDTLNGVDLSCLKGVFSGGDSLPIDLKNRFDKYLKEHNCSVHIREGYGTTECVTASCLTPYHIEKEGSIGIPLPDMYYKIVKPDTDEEVPYGEEGEICLAGPTVMLEYINNPAETLKARRQSKDGMTWIYTGDLGCMDKDGFIYFKQRIKRIIVTNGYNVYPTQIENILAKHKAVNLACVIGVKDPIRMKKVKAFIVLNEEFSKDDDTKESILEYCKKNIAKYALPREIEFRDELPKTLVGKVAYRKLEEEEIKNNDNK